MCLLTIFETINLSQFFLLVKKSAIHSVIDKKTTHFKSLFPFQQVKKEMSFF